MNYAPTSRMYGHKKAQTTQNKKLTRLLTCLLFYVSFVPFCGHLSS